MAEAGYEAGVGYGALDRHGTGMGHKPRTEHG